MADQDLSRPYIGYRSAGRRPESQNDRVASANAPLSAVRGYVAGTLGLPGDIEGLGRMLIPGVSNESYIPGSEYFRKVLPMRELENTPTGRAFSEMGNLTAGAGLTQAAKAGKAGARVVGEELNRAILDNSGALAKLVPQAAQPMYVVKPKGGNWLSGSIESTVDPLKQRTGARVATSQEEADDLIASGFVRDKLGGEGYYLPPNPVNKWIDQKLSKYIKNDLATPEDPIRALAEQGVVHAEVQPAYWQTGRVEYQRPFFGQPAKGLAESDLARRWETVSDAQFLNKTAKDHAEDVEVLADNPWLTKVPPETQVYGELNANNLNSDLGFDHLIDELRNAIDPNTTLPANLRLTPKQLDDVALPDAVKLVSKINDWRMAQAAEAEKAGMLDNLTAAPRLQDPTAQLSFVEKPGMTWVDIPATTNEKANKLCTTIGKQAGWCTQGNDLAKSYGSGQNRLTTLLDAEGRPHVQAQLTKQSEEARKADFLGQLNEEKYTRVLNEDPQQAKAMYMEWASKNPPSIIISELKPVGNTFSSQRAREYEKRDPQYQSKVTDSVLKFLNSGEWGKVNDLDHYNIVDLHNSNSVKQMLRDVTDYDLPHERMDKFTAATHFNPDAPRFMSRDQFREFVEPREVKEGFAEGGSVSAYDPFQVDEIMNSINAPRGYAEGGSVSAYDSDQIDAIANQFM